MLGIEELRPVVEETVRTTVQKEIEEFLASLRQERQRPAGLEVLVRNPAVREEERLDPGIRFARFVRALWLADRTPGAHPVDIAAKRWPHDEILHKQLRESAATAGGVLVPEEFAREVVGLLYDQAVVRRAGARVLAVQRDTLHIPTQTGAASAQYIAEAADIPASEQTFGEIVLTVKKLTALVPISNDLLADASPDVDRLVRDDIVRAMAAREDLAFIRDDGTSNKPRGIRFWADAGNVFTANATVNITNQIADLTRAVQLVLEGKKHQVVRPGWLMATRTFMWLRRQRDAAGWVFPEILEGRLLGYPVFVTDQIPTNLGAGGDESEIYFVDFDDALIAEREGLEVVASGEATYLSGSNLVSAFSRDLTVIRAITRHDFALRRSKAAAVITAVKWI